MKKISYIILILLLLPALSFGKIFFKSSVGKIRIATSMAPQTSTLASGLVGWWTFDGKDMPNGVASDVSGNGNKGNLTNIATTTFYVAGKLGQALNFDGVNDVITTTSESIGTGATTISAWIYPRAFNGIIIVNTGGKSTFQVDTSLNRLLFTSGSNARSANNAIPFNTWSHATVTRDASGVCNLYVNGVLSGTANQTCGTPTSAAQDFIGRASGGSGPFSGIIDDLRVYNRVLSTTEITQLFNTGIYRIKSGL